MKFRHIVLLLIASLSILTLALRGAVSTKTYIHSEIPASAVQASIVSYDPSNGVGWCVDDFSVDVENWLKQDQNVISSFYMEDEVLCLKTVFDKNQGHQSVRIFRSLNVDISELPIFSINISVSEGAIYHIRFVGEDSAGVRREVWWETSPLDDIPGKSRWEIHAVDLMVFSERATGSSVPTLTLVEIILENPHFYNSEDEKALRISNIGFSRRSLRVSNIPGHAIFISDNAPFQAVVIEVPHEYRPDETWSVSWAAVTYTLTSDSEFGYVIHLLSRSSDVLQDARGSVFLSHKNAFVDIYRLDATSEKVVPLSGESTFVWPLLGNFSILIIKRGFEPGGFLMFKLDSIELMCSNEKVKSDLVLEPGQVALISIGMAVAIIVVPNVLLALAFRYKPNSATPRGIFLLIPLAYGIVTRLLVAPLTGHPYDMGVWIQPVRLFYESGVVDIRTFPLPLTYYLLLLAYSPYALLRTLGFQDASFLAHRFKMVEAVFIKAPFIVFDILSFYFLLKIFSKLGNSKLNSSERFVYASMYFLSPLAILLSSVWGICDGIAVALFLAGIYYTLLEKKPFHGTFSYALSGLTKVFGFLGLIPLAVTSLKEKKVFQFLAMFGMTSAITILLYLPLLISTGIQAMPELFMQFLRGRVGLGSNPPYVASASYISYLSILGLNVKPPYLTCLVVALIILISIHFGLRIRNSTDEKLVELSLRYFAAVFFLFYLTFFRVYEQYYLWVIPVLIIYSYLKGTSGPRFMALSIALVASPILLLGALLTGVEYYWLPLNLPADAAIVAILPSMLAALALINIADLKGSFALLKTGRGMVAFAGPALWFSFGLAYYAYYGVLFLGVLWYPISLMIILIATAFLYRKLRSRNWKEVVGSYVSKWIARLKS